MRAAYLLSPGSLEVRETAAPRPQPGEVVVAIECAMTCGTDLKAYRRGHPFIPMPGRFGHQYAGRIESVGTGVRGFEPGMPILGVHSGPCGSCRPCCASRPNLCTRFSEQLVLGAFADQLLVTERVTRYNLHPRPQAMSAQRAAFLEPVSCVVHALSRIDFRGIDRVLVLGVGSMGLLFLQLLSLFTGAQVVAAGRRESRLALAHQCQTVEVWDVAEQSLQDRLNKQPAFDCVIECTGRAEGWQESVEAVLPGGVVMLFGGLPKGSTFPIDTYRLHYEELRVVGSFHFTPEDVRRSAELLASTSVPVETMISGERSLDQLEEALVAMEAGQGIKYAIVP